MYLDRIRNFSIIAHIDHGKSTLADRLLEHTKTLDKRMMREQVLDDMDLEREHGVTIKAHPIRLTYQARDGETYTLNLIDTPGHVDFTYEVSRSLAATEGVILLVDASQGVEAQTLAHLHLAQSQGKVIIPALNKIDLPAADIDRVKSQLEDNLGLSAEECLLISAKEGIGTEDILEAVIRRIPPPQGDPEAPLRALIFDSWFDSYQGAVIYLRGMDGTIKAGDRIQLMSTGKDYQVSEVGIFRLNLVQTEALKAGEVGYCLAGIKNITDTKIGDTITHYHRPAQTPLPGYKEAKPMVFCGLYPIHSPDYEILSEAIKRLHLNDTSWTYEPESSKALGFGYRCGFLGLFHSEIIQERLEREHNLELIATPPSVPYRITQTDGKVIEVDNPTNFPDSSKLSSMEEPYIRATIILPHEYLGGVMQLAQNRRGIQKNMEYLDARQVVLTYELPLNEIVRDFYDRLKSASRGYASFDYEHIGYRPTKLVKLDILIAGEVVDALSNIIPYEKAYSQGRDLALKLKEVIPRQQFAVAIQAAIGAKIIARETIPALRKNVTAKCYGGDITRKRKLLEKQKAGKKRLKQVGKIAIPQEAFRAILRID
ncbi:MAG: translation elongation factor 4 [bacterium]